MAGVMLLFAFSMSLVINMVEQKTTPTDEAPVKTERETQTDQ